MKVCLFIAAAAALALNIGTANADLTGIVRAIQDGDTFELCNQSSCKRIRICGINAPETGTPNAQSAREALQELTLGKTARCIIVGNGTICDGRSRATNRGRLIAQCFVGSTDIGGALVQGGFACDWVRFSGGAYGGVACPN